jgi:formylmethanofuran dehydrogenase subunit E
MSNETSEVKEAETRIEPQGDKHTDERCTKCGGPLEEGMTAYIKGRRVCWKCLIQR